MPTEQLTITYEGAIARITLNRPEVRNAFDDGLIEALTSALKRIECEPRTRVVVLSAVGKSFCAGADLNWMRRTADYSWEENFADAKQLGQLMQTLDQLALPTLARVQGAALGGGVGLIAVCDIAVAADTAFFALSEVKVGLIPAVISPYVVAAIGARAARRYFLTGERMTAHEALRLGLVHEVVSSEQLNERIGALTQALLGNGPQAVRAAKRLVRAPDHGALDTATLIEEMARRTAEQRASPEGKEGVAAFLEKRPPDWK